uniref:Uncharacterized protein n=1 Tax=Opuntia streptacantha TaxID=393608 RepID=A0A7C9DH28_OPUST
MLDSRHLMVPPDFYIVLGINRALQVLPQFRKSSDPFTLPGPDPDLTIKMTREDPAFIGRNDDGFDETASGLESAGVGEVLPDPDVPAFGPGVEHALLDRHGVYVALLPEKGPDEAAPASGVVEVIGFRRGAEEGER